MCMSDQWMCAAAIVLLSATTNAGLASERPDNPVLVKADDAIVLSNVSWSTWLDVVLQSVHSVDPGFVERPLVVRLEATTDRYPITFGRIRRVSPPEVHLQVHPDATMEALVDDWRGYHEIAHLLIPFPGNDDIWFSEGLASYYQYILQVRAGAIGADEAWQRLFAGFSRGLNDPAGTGRTLADLSPDMWRERAFRRVYWTGAAYFLRVDVRLRRESAGKHSLDSALAEFNRCWRDSREDWTARQLLDRLGQLTIPGIWQEEYEAMIDRVAVPDVDAPMTALGIEKAESGVRLSDHPDQKRLRDEIASGRSDEELHLEQSEP